ncbi:hypothetical protein Tco_0492548 [Tanacetum coccineum]
MKFIREKANQIFHVAQQIITAAQLVPKFQGIRRCNNYVVLHSIPCSPECKIVGKILLDHPLSYALTATADVPATVGYQGVVDKKKNVIQYPRFIKLIIADLIEKYPSIPRRHDEDYHSIKDDTLLFTKKPLKVTIKQKKQSTPSITPPGDDRERDEIAESTILSLTLHKTALATEAQENIAKVQEKLDEEEIKRMVEGEKDKESYEKVVVDEDVSKKNDDEKDEDEDEDEVNDDDVEKIDDVAEENDNDDHTDHTLVGTQAMSSMESRNEQMQTSIPTPTRSPKKGLSYDKTISEELTTTVSPTTATTSKDLSTLKSKKRSISYKTKILLGSIAGMWRRRGQIRTHIKNKFITHDFFMAKIREVLDHCNKVVPEMTFAKKIKEEMPRLVKLVVDKDRENTPINVSKLISK